MAEREFTETQESLRKMVTRIPLALPDFGKDVPIEWKYVKIPDFPFLHQLITPPSTSLKTYDVEVSKATTYDSKKYPINLCQQCIKNIGEYVRNRRCFNMSAALKLNDFMRTRDNLRDISMVYIGIQEQKGGYPPPKKRPQPRKEFPEKEEYLINEEHIVPVNIMKAYNLVDKSVIRGYHPFSTDFNCIFSTIKSINEARSNFPLGNIRGKQISGYIKFNQETKTVDVIYEAWKHGPPDDSDKWNKIYEGQYPHAGYLGAPELGFGNHCFGILDKPEDSDEKKESRFLYCLFEPLYNDKGKIARTYLYYFCAYAAIYPDLFKTGATKRHFNFQTINDFLEWNHKFPVTHNEKLRAIVINHYQETLNPFVALPIIAEKTFLSADFLQSYLKEHQSPPTTDKATEFTDQFPDLFPQNKYTFSDIVFRGVPHELHFPFKATE